MNKGAPWTIERGLRLVRWLCIGVVLAAAGLLAYGLLTMPRPAEATVTDEAALAWPEPVRIPPSQWEPFLAVDDGAESAGPLVERFRLAGTFVAFGVPSARDGVARRAIIDDLKRGNQVLVRMGDPLDEFEVTGIEKERLLLRDGAREYALSLSFSGKTGAAPEPAPADEAPPGPGQEVLELTDFGKRVGERRWVLSRDKLLGYYEELLDNPERLASLYLSMKPDYREGVIAGYRVGVEGEADFFRQMGFREGDVVRKVNSMRMVSQNRAEYFIREFIKDRLGAVVFDIERDGKPEKLIHLIR